MPGFTYILASKKIGTLYVGGTNDLARRMFEHREGLIKGFTSRYKVHLLVWYEQFDRIEDAIACEKRIKEWKRAWKLELIEKFNPDWRDLYFDLAG